MLHWQYRVTLTFLVPPFRFLQHVDVKVEKLRQSVGRDGGSLEQTELAIDM